MENTEVELKFPLIDPKTAIDKVKSLSRKKKDESQKDTYFIPAHRDFMKEKPVLEWLRLRESDKGITLNYKKWHPGEKRISCDEFETKIEDIEAFRKILENLNFKELIKVEKARSSWEYKETEISIDEIKDLGHFIEIEAKGKFSSIEEAKKHLYNILNELNIEVGEQDFKGYPYLMLEKKGLLQ